MKMLGDFFTKRFSLPSFFGLSTLIFLSVPAKAEQIPEYGPVVVITGGYDSCSYDESGAVTPFGGNFNSEGVRFVNEMQQKFATINRGVRWLFSCFNKESTLYVQDNSDAAVVGSEFWDINFIIDRIERQSDNYKRPVYIIGHSHGGWLAMQTALSLRKSLVGGYLATIDPISFIDCNASTFADALLWGGGWDHLAPCRRAPQDMGNWAINQIKKSIPSGSWRHYYQTNFAPLHSGPMNGPDRSLDMSPFLNLNGGGAGTYNGHIRIANLSSIWTGLKVSLERDFGLNQ